MKTFLTGLAMALSMASLAQTYAVLPNAIEDRRMDDYLVNRKPATLKIRLVNATGNTSTLKIRYTIVHPGSESQVTETTSFGVNNESTIVLQENLPYQQVWLSVDSFYYTGLLVNSALEVTIDAAKIKEEISMYGDGISFNGTDAGLNRQMALKVLHVREERSSLLSSFPGLCIRSANGLLQTDALVKSADSVYRIVKKYDDDFLKQHPEFAWAVDNERDSWYLGWLIVAFYNKPMPSGILDQVRKHQPLFMSNDGVAF
ncbi:MAG: hypothetical protein EOP49_25250, partial [Sphingobacteriales bacterium]